MTLIISQHGIIATRHGMIMTILRGITTNYGIIKTKAIINRGMMKTTITNCDTRGGIATITVGHYQIHLIEMGVGGMIWIKIHRKEVAVRILWILTTVAGTTKAQDRVAGIIMTVINARRRTTIIKIGGDGIIIWILEGIVGSTITTAATIITITTFHNIRILSVVVAGAIVAKTTAPQRVSQQRSVQQSQQWLNNRPMKKLPEEMSLLIIW